MAGAVAGSMAGWPPIERAPQETESIYSVSVTVDLWLDKTFSTDQYASSFVTLTRLMCA